jgi:phosphatidate cytidylyltransferase
VQRPGRDNPGAFRVRLVSALVLAAPVLGAIYLGSPFAEALVLLAGGVMAWEWARISGQAAAGALGVAGMAAVLCAIAVGALGHMALAGWIAVTGAMAAVLLAIRARHPRPLVCGLGVAYVAVPCLAFLWLLHDPAYGRQTVFWLLAVVWSTEIGAYLAGRGLGGAKLAPTISPNKTWAGFFGGLAAAALVSAIIGAAAPGVAAGRLALLSTLLALVAQSGDLVESALKRLFGVKDSSGLIPGHGGLLDRVDGLMAGSLAVAAFAWLAKGEL